MKKNFGKIFILAAFFTLIDQFSKVPVLKYLGEGNSYNLIGNFFKFEYAENTGIAFGIPIPSVILSLLIIVLIMVIIYFAAKELNLNSKLSQFNIALILGGALGNFIDRITNGAVIDFISIWKWPNFNLADSFITIGVLLTVIFYAKIKQVKPN